MDIKSIIEEASTLFKGPPPTLLSAQQPSGEIPLNLLITIEHTEHYLSLETGPETMHGTLTGILSLGSIFFIIMGLWMALDSQWDGAALTLTIAPALFITPFIWESQKKVPLPIIINRRTREIYFDHNGQLFHTPWDEIQAITYEFHITAPYSGSMRYASLEILIHRLGEPENALMLSLGLPAGKSIEMQKGFWEYLRAYMDKGPWLDAEGQHSESDSFVKSQLAARIQPSDFLRIHLNKISEIKTANEGKNYLSAMDTLTLAVLFISHPVSLIQRFTYNIAKRRTRNRWPEIVLERLRPDGPTTRLIDLERERGLKV